MSWTPYHFLHIRAYYLMLTKRVFEVTGSDELTPYHQLWSDYDDASMEDLDTLAQSIIGGYSREQNWPHAFNILTGERDV